MQFSENHTYMKVNETEGIDIPPKIMIPLVINTIEFRNQVTVIREPAVSILECVFNRHWQP